MGIVENGEGRKERGREGEEGVSGAIIGNLQSCMHHYEGRGRSSKRKENMGEKVKGRRGEVKEKGGILFLDSNIYLTCVSCLKF